MNTFFDNHFKKQVVTIYPGEFYSSAKDEMISTVLGSCVSVAMFDIENKIGGLNHYMLAKDNSSEKESKIKANNLPGKFGENAIRLLIEDLINKGAVRENLQAKVFGGGNIFNAPANSGTQVGEANIKFAIDELKKLNIPVVTSDTGGNHPRKIFFDPISAKVFMKYVHNSNVDDLNSEELSEEENKELTFLKNVEIKAVKNLFPDAPDSLEDL